jgi:alanyl-tRNA synthetase
MERKSYGVNELREMFLQYFESKGHLRLPSFPLVPQHDKSILLINAGMTPMKPYFTGEEEPPRHRVCTCQKCIRTADIDNIGKTARHGTYFEMLGNFSFGDYFKREALNWCWEFLTKIVGLEEDRLYPSVYENDDEAFEIWNKEIGIPAERIFRFGKEDNFWEHGSGPCGPCSEVYYDRGEAYGCGKPGCTVGCDCDRYMEIWNNVFSQFENDGHGNYTELRQKNIDTGMGLERLAVASQNVASIFDVDTVMNITRKVTELTGASYGRSHEMDVSLRVITDHIRSAAFLICDGVLPSNEGRGYVLRRLLRRAARHGKLLGVNTPFLYEVVDTVVHENECRYPDLREKQTYITRVVRTEEETFCKTIDGGMKIYNEMLAVHREKKETVFSGADAFKLYDTFGFPIDLTIEMAAEAGYRVDEQEFTRLMQEQKKTAREARKALGDLGWAGIEFGKEVPSTQFVGYQQEKADGQIVALIADGELCGTVTAGMEAIVVLDATPMYAEMGGQVGDHGTISTENSVFTVTDVQKNKGGKYMHYGKLLRGELRLGDRVTSEIDRERRSAICRAHTATHLLQAALEKVLGAHCHQAGSLVEPDHLRFDFTHFAAVTPEELMQIGNTVVETVLDGLEIQTLILPIEEARKLGATALFGEKYGQTVRVVKMGETSLEFCGGTHLDNTAKVGMFRIISEGSVASGVRRIEAITGKAVLQQTEQFQKTLLELAETIKAPSIPELLHKAQSMVGEMKELQQQLQTMKDRAMSGEIDQFMVSAKSVAGLNVLTMVRREVSIPDLRKYGDLLRDRNPKIVAVLASVQEDKISILAVCGSEAVKKGVKAGALVKQVCTVCGGSGGGKPDSAMGGGRDAMKLDDAMASVDDFVAENAKA